MECSDAVSGSLLDEVLGYKSGLLPLGDLADDLRAVLDETDLPSPSSEYVTFYPKPGFIIKTVCEKTTESWPIGIRVILNVCYSDEVDPILDGSKSKIEEGIRKKEASFEVPSLVSPPRYGVLKSGKNCVLVDFCVSITTYAMLVDIPDFSLYIMELALESAERRCNFTLSRNFTLPKRTYMGKVLECRIPKPQKYSIREINTPLKPQNKSKCRSNLLPPPPPDPPLRRPLTELVYAPSSKQPLKMVLKMALRPASTLGEDYSLHINESNVVFYMRDNYYLHFPLSWEIDIMSEDNRAQFHAKTGFLVVSLKVASDGKTLE